MRIGPEASAVVGNTPSAEHTRVLRAGMNYSINDDMVSMGQNATTAANLVVSHGLDVFDAHMQGSAGAGSDFTKANLRLGRDQPLPDNFVARLRTTAQFTGDPLTASPAPPATPRRAWS